MSSATLLVAERNDLVGAARIAVSVFPNVELVTADAGQFVASAVNSPPSAAIVPVSGTAEDGLILCRQLKQRFPECPIMMIVDDEGGRAAAVQAGADDIVVGAPDADALRDRLGRLKGVSFKQGERVEFPLAVNLTLGNQSYPAQSVAMSHDACFIAWPSPPAVGTAMKVAFSPYEGKTIDVWGRVQISTGPGGTDGIQSEGALVRFLGLTEDEIAAVRYLVDYYMKAAGIEPGQGNGVSPFDVSDGANDDQTAKSKLDELVLGEDESVERPVTATPGREGLEISDPWDQLTETSAGRQMIIGSLTELSTVAPEELASGAAKYSKSRDATALPGGVTGEELRGFLPRLSAVETSAMRGTSTMADLTGMFLACAGIRLQSMILTARFRTLTKKISDAGVQFAAEEAVNRIIEACGPVMEQLEGELAQRLAAANMDAARDLKTVHQGVADNLQQLKRALAGNVFGADVQKREAEAAKQHAQARYDQEAFDEKAREEARKQAKKKKKAYPVRGGDGKKRLANPRTIAILAVLLIGAIGGTVWSYVPKGDKPFVAPNAAFTVDGVNVIDVLSIETELRIFVDATIYNVPDAQKVTVLNKIVETSRQRAAADPALPILVYGHDRKVLAQTDPGGALKIN